MNKLYFFSGLTLIILEVLGILAFIGRDFLLANGVVIIGASFAVGFNILIFGLMLYGLLSDERRFD